MQQIINFLIRNKTFIIFLVLFSIALGITFQSHNYHNTKLINSANWVSGGVYSTTDNVSDYFHLKEYNEQLLEENKQLRKLLFNREIENTDSLTIADSVFNQYRIYTGRVIKNSYTTERNYLLIDKGTSDSIRQDMGVITSQGIVGIIENTSSGYATVQSVLNTLSEINAAVKNTNNFGSLQWDGKNIDVVQLVDILRAAPIKAGDTIITGGMSSIFPKGIPIGTIKDFNLDISENYYKINVQLFNDMSTLDQVYIIENTDKQEIEELEESLNE
ncbi:rod shape-determining protein MreC [Robertkochia solimangrovi]|uniref:rod shape-determining protein MreC n=1 Tax=Robertkochia solimangrovi TaxID=2213046 RepID=UPI00118043B3|nr:rod shape-determining protein MreC [Robertkochia solimangrovi]TRZ43238.1 rod shape-determining protein MreC [Robertkochia solimangrovi]